MILLLWGGGQGRIQDLQKVGDPGLWHIDTNLADFFNNLANIWGYNLRVPLAWLRRAEEIKTDHIFWDSGEFRENQIEKVY